MKIVDANVLLYAVNKDSEHHEDSRAWLDSALSGAERVGFTWVALLALVRIATHPRIFPRPLTPAEAMARVTAWLASPHAVVVAPASGHDRALATLLENVGVGGNMVNDAHLAVVALEQRCAIVTYDRDFQRFDGVLALTTGEILRAE
jgi:toxin-antitoxin system PIN domain toxin